MSNQSQNLNQDQTSDEDILDDTDTDEESSKKQLPMTNRKATKSKAIGRSTNDELNNSVIKLKRLFSTIFPTTNDTYGFQLDGPSTESLHCYEEFARMGHYACSLSVLNSQRLHELSVSSNQSASSTSSFET